MKIFETYGIFVLTIFCFSIVYSNFDHMVYGQNSDRFISFFGISKHDNMETAKNILAGKDIIYIKGKSPNMEIDIPLNDITNNNTNNKLEKIIAIDKVLLDFGKNEKVKDMKINVINCRMRTESPFEYWNYYYSSLTGELLNIIIKLKEPIDEELSKKYGDCILSSGCHYSDDMVIYSKQENKIQVLLLFPLNINEHFLEVSANEQKKIYEKDKIVEEAF